MTLAELLQELEGQVTVTERTGDMTVRIDSLTDDSRAVRPGSLFVAVKGERVDGHGFIRIPVEPWACSGAAFMAIPPRGFA
jgi:UDP-N-acetylmuramyl pentapeptide synthase